MTCTSGSVQKVADKTVKAKQEIEKLQKMIEEQDNNYRKKFFDQIDTNLDAANITDARQVDYNSDIKTEFTSEFSLDKIAAVVTSALKAAAKATDPKVPEAATSPEAIEAYTDIVNTVAEAAKSSSTSAASLSFSMNRLSPGIYAFLYASSTNIKDEDTFGSEAVTATAIYYRFMESIDDLKNEAAFGQAIIDANNLINMKRIQASLTDELANDQINIDDWLKKDKGYSLAIKRIQKRLDDAHFDTAQPMVLTKAHGFGAPVSHSFANGSAGTQEIVRAAIKRLSAKGDSYKNVIEISEGRLSSIYY